MKLLLLPQYYVPSFNDEITNSNEMDMECSVMHDNNTRIFETVMKNLSNRLSINQTNEQLCKFLKIFKIYVHIKIIKINFS